MSYKILTINGDVINTVYHLGIFVCSKYDGTKKEKFGPNQYRIRSKSMKVTKLHTVGELHWASQENEQHILTIKKFK